MARLGLSVVILVCLAQAVSAQTNFATLVPDGAWTWFNDPRALFHNGILYVGYVRSSDGRSGLNAFNPATGATTNLWTSSRTLMDDHHNPGLLVRPDGRMLAVYARHNSDQFFSYRLSSTTNPVSPADWSVEQTSSPTGAGVTFANPYRLAEEPGTIYNFCRNLNYDPTVVTSIDGGTNWSAPRLFINAGGGTNSPFVKYDSDRAARIDFIYSDGHPRDLSNSLYHAFYRGGAIYRSDGALLKNFDDIPLMHDSGERGSVIYHYSDDGTSDVNDHIPTGRAWPWGIASGTNGQPACVFSVQCDRVLGTNWFDDRIYYYYARWTGTNWQKRFIAHAGRPLYNPESDYAGGICIDPEDPNVVYISSNAADPFDLQTTTNVPLRAGDRYEIFRGITADGGLSFQWTALTENSKEDNLRPYVPSHEGNPASVIWLRGAYRTLASFNCSVVGLFPNPIPRRERVEFESRLWRTEDGLPHNSVQAITQTSDGFLWIGTRQGLVQFDGIHFKSIPELTNVPITAVCEDREKKLWIGTDGAGLRRYHNGKFEAIDGGTNSAEDTVRAIFVRQDGSIWIGTTNGLSTFRNGKIVRPFEQGIVRSICENKEGDLLLATSEGLKQYGDGRFTAMNGIPGGPLRAVHCGRNGEIWAGSSTGVNRLDSLKTTSLTRSDGLASDTINTLYEDSNGNIWIGTAGGVNYLSKDGVVHEIRHEGESLDLVYSICEDREGNLWVGARDGLHRLNVKYFTTYTKQHGLANNDVTSVVQDVFGRMWVGTWGGGLHAFVDGSISRVISTNRFFNDLVLGLWADRLGNLWIGTDFDGGMFRYERGQFVRYWREQGISSLADPAVRAILVDNQKGRVWVGSRDALNVAFRGKAFQRYTTQNGMAGNTVRVIFEDDEGSIWVGTNDGLTQFKDDTLINYTVNDGLSHNTVTAIYQDGEHALWIGTAGGGINRLLNGKFTSYDMREGLYSDEVLEIIEDNCNRLWMTSRSGIFWVSKQDIKDMDAGRIRTLRCVSYGKDDGLLSVTCNNIAKPSAWKSRDGRLWFATVKGLAVVDPLSVPDTHSKQPPVVIQEILCDGKSFMPADDLKLPAGRGELEFHFTTLSFRGSERDRFKYKLEGVDHEWTDAGPRRFAHYNNILHGNYHFRVMACNSDGVWNEIGAAVAITLLPQYWETWWVRCGIFLAAGLLVVSIYKVRVDQIRELERLRLRIATDLHDEIGSSMGSITLLTNKIQKEGPLAPDQKGDLASISRISMQAGNSIRDIVWFVNPEYDTMQDLLLRMRDVANTMLGGMEISFNGPHENLSRKLSLDFRRNIFLIFKEILGNIAKHSQATKVEIAISEKLGVWELLVSDNGTGFDPDAVKRGNGLRNLRRRADKLEGLLAVKSQPGRGTTIAFSTRKLQ